MFPSNPFEAFVLRDGRTPLLPFFLEVVGDEEVTDYTGSTLSSLTLNPVTSAPWPFVINSGILNRERGEKGIPGEAPMSGRRFTLWAAIALLLLFILTAIGLCPRLY